jgi:phenylalanyl-tRNA synthetase alpha chain
MYRKMIQQIEKILPALKQELAEVTTTSGLEQMRVKYLGRKGALTNVLRNLAQLTEKEKPVVGRLANEVKTKILELLQAKEQELKLLEARTRIEREELDISLPGCGRQLGHRHPIRDVLEQIKSIFVSMGFDIVEGPDIESDFNNFEALNIPPDHPAREMQDTFYVTDTMLLRTHTSPVQIRAMKVRKPPLAIIAPGKVYRRDADISHSPMFHQVEGFMVDKHISLGDLKGVLEVFVREIFGTETAMRFRPSFFPFTEPSAELDIRCVMCRGEGCRVCKESGWLEIVGAGMIHPVVFCNVGYDPDHYTGFAFGMGVERIAMLKYSINDIRLFFENDLRFLRQF